MGCIFVEEQYPDRCSICLESRKLSCLQDRRHMKVSEQGAKDLHKELDAEINHKDRYKTKSGQEQRPTGEGAKP